MTCESSGSARPHLTHAPRERPVLFSGAMVRAILEGRKTQTRRVIKPQPEPIDSEDMRQWCRENGWRPWWWSCSDVRSMVVVDEPPMKSLSPYGSVGDRLWVRETFRLPRNVDNLPPSKVPAHYRVWYPSTESMNHDGMGESYEWWVENYAGKSRPSIHMPRWMSRVLLEVTGARVERVQDISKQDCIAEGITQRGEPSVEDPFGRRVTWTGVDGHQFPWARAAFASLWESINWERGYGWEKNPWVWVVEFEPVQKVDHVEGET